MISKNDFHNETYTLTEIKEKFFPNIKLDELRSRRDSIDLVSKCIEKDQKSMGKKNSKQEKSN